MSCPYTGQTWWAKDNKNNKNNKKKIKWKVGTTNRCQLNGKW